MKRFALVLSLLIALMFTNQLFAQGALRNGFSLNGTIGKSYNYDGVLMGIEFGNRWYVFKKDQFGIAVMANWLDFAMGFNRTNPSSYYSDYSRVAMDFTFLENGPLATYALTNDIAFDGYFNLRPTAYFDINSYISSGDAEVLNTKICFGLSNLNYS